MRLIRLVLLLCISLASGAVFAQQVTGIWEGALQKGPGTLRVDFDNSAASLNSGPALEIEVLEGKNAQDVRFQAHALGQVFPFAGVRNGAEIVGKLANWQITFTQLPDTTAPIIVRKIYPYPHPQTLDDKAIEKAHAMAGELVHKMDIPGLSVAVARNGQVVWSEGFGLADVEQNVPVTPETLFRVGSVSKVLTAAGVAKLVQDGKLDLDAPIQKYVPDFPVKKWPITTRELASHSAGIRHYSPADNKGPHPLNNNPHFASIKESLTIFENDPLLFEPGTSYNYSSYGFNLISAVMEGASGEEFLSYMQENVFEPLGLRHIAPDHVIAIIPHRASFYAREAPGKPLEHASYKDNSYKWASGGYLASAEDLVRFGSAHLKPGFFSQSTLDVLFTGYSTIPPSNHTSVGIGWNIGQDGQGRRMLHHSGTSEGGRAVLLVLPDSGIVVAMLANILAPFDLRQAESIGLLFDHKDL